MGVKRLFIPILLIGFVVLTHSAPSRVKYDQRQEGDLNVRADLENFVILVIPTTAGASPSTLGLLDLLSKAIPMRGHNKRQKNVRKPVHAHPAATSLLDDVSEEETQTFIESKTAPYHVDISKSRKNLAKLHPNLEKIQDPEELLVSPNLSLIKSAEDINDDGNEEVGENRQSRVLRLSKGYVLSMPLEVEEGLVKIDNKRIEKSSETKEFKDKDCTDSKGTKDTKEPAKKSDFVKNKGKSGEPKLKLLLVGAEHNEECGPGYERDANGICKFLAHV